MLMDIKARIQEPEIQELLSYAVFPSPEKLARTVGDYTGNPSLELCGYVQEEELVGLIGFTVEQGELLIRHLAVKPECRGLGFGRGLILEAIDRVRPVRVIAETDEDAVDFYRWIGFEIEGLGEKYPGVERFRCSFET